jgi:hypothetical protein
MLFVLLSGVQRKGIQSEMRVKYGLKFCGTWTGERQRWQSPVAVVPLSHQRGRPIPKKSKYLRIISVQENEKIVGRSQMVF